MFVRSIQKKDEKEIVAHPLACASSRIKFLGIYSFINDVRDGRSLMVTGPLTATQSTRHILLKDKERERWRVDLCFGG